MGDRDVGDVVAGGDDLGGQAPRARRRRRASVTAGELVQRHALAGDERDLAARQLGRRAARARRAWRTARPSRRARPCARTDRRCRGRATTLPAPNASAERMTVPTLPGSLDAPERDAARARSASTSAAGRPPSARVPEPSWETSASTCGATGMPSSPLPVDGVARRGVPARGVGGLQQVLALGHELAQLVAPAPSGELADLLERFVVGAGDLGHRSDTKKGAAPEGGAPW